MVSLFEAVVTSSVVLLLTLVVRRLAQALSSPSDHDGVPRPPLMSSWLPFVGNALGIASGDEFWVKAERKYGPVIRILLMGGTKTFLTDRDLIHYVYKHSTSFDYLFFRKRIQGQIFGSTHKVAFGEIWDNHLFEAHHRAMQPGSLAGAIKRYADELEGIMMRRMEDWDGGREVDMVEYIYDIIYTASSRALFGSTFPSAATKRPFLVFDKVFPLLNLETLPTFMVTPARKAREEMISLLTEWWGTLSEEEKGQVAPHLGVMLEHKDSEGWSDRDWASLLLSELWALEANAPWAALWTVIELLRRPLVLQSLRSEIDSAISTLTPPTLSTLLQLPQSRLITTLPRINAAFQETLRFHTDSFSLRVVQSDTVIPPSLCGHGIGRNAGLSLKAGEQVVCVGRKNQISPDGDWGGDANVWDADRFLRDGKRGTTSPFGGGISMCEGRHFASAEIITFVASFVHLAEAVILKDTLRHKVDRPGLGMIQTKGDFRVRLERRASPVGGSSK